MQSPVFEPPANRTLDDINTKITSVIQNITTLQHNLYQQELG